MWASPARDAVHGAKLRCVLRAVLHLCAGKCGVSGSWWEAFPIVSIAGSARPLPTGCEYLGIVTNPALLLERETLCWDVGAEVFVYGDACRLMHAVQHWYKG